MIERDPEAVERWQPEDEFVAERNRHRLKNARLVGQLNQRSSSGTGEALAAHGSRVCNTRARREIGAQAIGDHKCDVAARVHQGIGFASLRRATHSSRCCTRVPPVLVLAATMPPITPLLHAGCTRSPHTAAVASSVVASSPKSSSSSAFASLRSAVSKPSVNQP